MELSDYLRLLIRRWWVFTLPILILGLLFGRYGYHQPTTYDGFASLSFVKPNEASKLTPPADYRFDNFYSLQAGQLLSATVHGWLADATFIAQIYTSAQVALPNVPVSQYPKLIDTSPLPGSTLLVKTNAGETSQAQQLAAAAVTLVKSRLDQLASQGTIDPVVVLTSPPLQQPHPPNSLLILMIGLILGALIGLISVGLTQTFWPIRH